MFCITFHSSHGVVALYALLPLCQYSLLFRPSSSLEYQYPLPAPFGSSDMSKKKGKRKASGPATKSCNGCGRELPQDDYSKKQWGREDGACITCTDEKTRKHNADAKARAIAAKTESQRVESAPLAVDRSLAALRAPSKKSLTTTVAGNKPKAAGSASALTNTRSESSLLEDRRTTKAAGSASVPNGSESSLLEDRRTTKAAGSASAPNTRSESLLPKDRHIVGGGGSTVGDGGSTKAAVSASAPNTRSESLLLEDRPECCSFVFTAFGSPNMSLDRPRTLLLFCCARGVCYLCIFEYDGQQKTVWMLLSFKRSTHFVIVPVAA